MKGETAASNGMQTLVLRASRSTAPQAHPRRASAPLIRELLLAPGAAGRALGTPSGGRAKPARERRPGGLERPKESEGPSRLASAQGRPVPRSGRPLICSMLSSNQQH